MRNSAYHLPVSKPLLWLGGTEVKTPPVGERARRDLGAALRVLQIGGQLEMPLSRPMPSIGPRVHELRVRDEGKQWRLIYRTDADAILVVDLFRKSTQKTPKMALERAWRRLRTYDEHQD
jgi:phage-related protein